MLQEETTSQGTYLCEDGASMVGYRRCLLTVENDGSVVERLLRVLQDEVDLAHSALKQTAEVAWYQSPTDG